MSRHALLATVLASLVPACAATDAVEEPAANEAQHLEASRETTQKTFSGSVVVNGETLQVSVEVTHPKSAIAEQRTAFISSAFVGCTVTNEPYPAKVRVRVVSSSNDVLMDDTEETATSKWPGVFGEECEDWRRAPYSVEKAETVLGKAFVRFNLNGVSYRLGGTGWGVPGAIGVNGELTYTATSRGVFTEHAPAEGGIFEEFVVPKGQVSLELGTRIRLSVAEDVQLIDETTPLPSMTNFEALAP